MFIWLLMKGRIQCRSNLFRKKVVDSPTYLDCGAEEETADHLVFQCPPAAHFWEAIGFHHAGSVQTRNLHCLSRATGIPNDQYSAFVALCCWQLWKRRNALVFRQESLNLRQLILSCKAEGNLWRAKMPRKSKKIIDDWSKVFDDAVNLQDM